MEYGLALIFVGLIACMASFHFNTVAAREGGIDWFRSKSTKAEFNGKMAYVVMGAGWILSGLGWLIL